MSSRVDGGVLRAKRHRARQPGNACTRIAIRLMAKRGYESTTLREVAKEAGVSVGLLYRYFPSKRAIIIALYDDLSADYARQAVTMPRGRWRDRFIFALKTSLQVLEPHRVALRALIPVLVGDPEEGVFAESAAFSRLRVQRSIRGSGRRINRCAGTRPRGSSRSPSLSGASRRASLVAAGPDREAARHRALSFF